MQLGDRYGDLFQMSYITRDLDAAMEHSRQELGIEQFHVADPVAPVLCEGRIQDLTIRAAMANLGRHQFEIIQPVAGPTHIYTDEVDLSGHLLNFHHIAIAVRGEYDAFEQLLAEVRESGDTIAYLMPAEPDPSAMVAFCYVDTRRRIGHYTEYLWWHPSLGGTHGFPNLDA